MSLKPGIGAKWLIKYKSDVYPNDYVILRGRKVKPPKYYDRLIQSMEVLGVCGAYTFNVIVQPKRVSDAKLRLDDNTVSRLAVKEQVALCNLSRSKRILL